MSPRLHCTLLLFLIFSAAVAQTGPPSADIPLNKDHVPDGRRLRAALRAMERGDALSAKGGEEFAAAMEAYRQAYAINPELAGLDYKMGVCLLNGPTPHNALPLLQRAAELDPHRPRVHFLLGCALQLHARWDEAIAHFQEHDRIIRSTPDADRTFLLVDKHIQECQAGKALMAVPVEARVTNLGPGINSEGSEHGAMLDGKGNLYFSGHRTPTVSAMTDKAEKRHNHKQEELYRSRWTAQGWSIPEQVPDGTDTTRNQAPAALPDGAEQGSRTWRTNDGHWLYFVSDRPGGMGGSDIYRSAWDQAVGAWGPAANLGPVINTPYDEEDVYAPGDGRTIHFASRGHNTMGGFDLFKATCNHGIWTRPVNLGWPINSPGDDGSLVITADGRTGYFNSMRAGGQGGQDLYRVELPTGPRMGAGAMLASAGGGAAWPEEEQRMQLIGFIKGLKMMEPVPAVIEVTSLSDPTFQAAFQVDKATGRFVAEVPTGQPYAVHVKADGYLLHTEHVHATSGTQELNMALKPAVAGSAEVLRNVFFDHDTFALDSVSMVELTSLVGYLKANPGLRVEIGGHTDGDVGPIPNQALSEARAQAVVDWLVTHGIAPQRLRAKGYGEASPVAPNDTRANKALNRRTEIRVL